MARIELRGVTKIFGPRPARALAMLQDNASKEAILEDTGHTVGLDNVWLTIEKGQSFVVMGLSGSGKSTLIRHINRLIEPTAGEVVVDGEDVRALDRSALMAFRRRRTSMVFQRFGLFPHRTVAQNVAFGLDVQADGRAARKANRGTAQTWIETVGLAGYEDSFPHELSGGMQQRVGLARALATDADILLMDEPFSALDPLIRRDMQDQLAELQAKLHKTIVFITHDLDEALKLGDRIAILKDGAVEQVGSRDDILNAPASDYVAAFTQDVNRGRALTAGAAKRDCVVVEADAAPSSVLVAVRGRDPEVAYVVDAKRRLIGAATVAAIRRAVRDNAITLESAVEPVPIAPADMILDEVLPLTLKSAIPIAVSDEEGKVVGMLSRDAIIEALANGAGSRQSMENT